MTTRKDYRLFLALLSWALLPSVYLLVRMRIVTIAGVDLDILGQMEWFDLIDEVLVTTLTIPLYSLLHPETDDAAGTNTIVFAVSLALYSAFTALAVLNITSVAEYMNAAGAERYLTMQAFSMLMGFTMTFGILLLTVNGDGNAVHILTMTRLAALVCFDSALIPKWGEIGAADAELAANAVVAAAVLTLCVRRGYLARMAKPRKAFLSAWVGRGLFAGVQIFLDNFVYAVMICKMVNAVHESGSYWVANNFIWGWLLIPVSCFAEVIRKNNLERLNMRNTWRFGLAIAAAWAVSLPLWGWFVENAMSVGESGAIMRIVYPSAVFYLSYIPSAFLDAWFVSKGKTWYLTLISAVVNLVYYGLVYLLFRHGIFTPSMTFIIQMFGWGMVVHLLLSVSLYAMDRKKNALRFG